MTPPDTFTPTPSWTPPVTPPNSFTPTPSASPAGTATVSPTPGCQILGYTAATGGAVQFSGSLNAQQLVLANGGLLNKMLVQVWGVTNGVAMKAGLYADAGNYPGTLVAES